MDVVRRFLVKGLMIAGRKESIGIKLIRLNFVTRPLRMMKLPTHFRKNSMLNSMGRGAGNARNQNSLLGLVWGLRCGWQPACGSSNAPREPVMSNGFGCELA